MALHARRCRSLSVWRASGRRSSLPDLRAIDDGVSRIVGGAGFGCYDDEPFELGYWITPNAWSRGYATEADAAVISIGQARLRSAERRQYEQQLSQADCTDPRDRMAA